MMKKLKKTISLFVLAALLLVTAAPLGTLAAAKKADTCDLEIWDGSVAASFSGGSGTDSDPYLISNGSELALLAQLVNESSVGEFICADLVNDIYLNDISDWQSWSEENAPANSWTPIGKALMDFNEYGSLVYDFSRSYRGFFNGNGHTVYGVYVCDLDGMDGTTGYGLFGCIGGGDVNDSNPLSASIDLVNVDASFICAAHNAGAIVGVHSGGVVGWCSNRGTVIGYQNTGGVVGHGFGTIVSCENYGEVYGVINTGGIAGAGETGFMNCANRGSVFGLEAVGGIVGEGYESDVVYSFNTGSVGGESNVGGIVGSQISSFVAACWNSGEIYGEAFDPSSGNEPYCFGGITGSLQSRIVIDSEGIDTLYPSRIENCYNTGSVSGDESAGGIVGSSSEEGCSIDCCYTVGTVSAQNNGDAIIGFGGGFIGDEITNCYYLAAEGAQSPYAEALTEAQLMDSASYDGFDFDSVWTMDGDADYPFAELIMTPHEGGTPPQPTMLGDVDGNGSITIADSILTLRLSLGLADGEGIYPENADADGSGSVTVADAIIIARMALGIWERHE